MKFRNLHSLCGDSIFEVPSKKVISPKIPSAISKKELMKEYKES